MGEAEINKQQEERRTKIVMQIVSLLGTTALPSSPEDQKGFNKVVAQIIDILCNEGVTLGEQRYILQNASAIFQMIFNGAVQTIDMNMGDKLAYLLGKEKYGEILVKEITIQPK